MSRSEAACSQTISYPRCALMSKQDRTYHTRTTGIPQVSPTKMSSNGISTSALAEQFSQALGHGWAENEQCQWTLTHSSVIYWSLLSETDASSSNHIRSLSEIVYGPFWTDFGRYPHVSLLLLVTLSLVFW